MDSPGQQVPNMEIGGEISPKKSKAKLRIWLVTEVKSYAEKSNIT